MTTFKQLVDETQKLAAKKGFHFRWEDAPKWLMYLVSECGEAMEAWRDDDREHFQEELVDIAIRLAHMVGDLGFRDTFDKALREKQDKNWKRPPGHGRKNV